MSAPLPRQLFASKTPEARFERQIDNHYHLEMIAQDSHQIVEYQAQSLRMQYDAAITNLRGMAEIATRQDQTNSLLATLVGGVDLLNDSLDELNATAYETLDAIYAQTEVLHDGFQLIAERLLQEREVLEQIADILRHPYETEVSDLLEEADRALKQGMQSTGRDQKGEFTDATDLLNKIMENPIGRRNYVAWFQVGWLKWKYERKFAEAEEAFYQASRLSAPKADLYHAKSLRHMAYMQYLQGRFQDAYDSIHKAMLVRPDDHDIQYDAARYAARTGREAEALELLEKCIGQQPQTIVMMFSEEDFLQ